MIVLGSARLPGRPEPVDIVVDGDRVARLAPAGVRRTSGAEVLDLGGRWVIPGLWDAHAHVGLWAQTSRRLDVSGAGSAAEVTRMVRAAIEAAPPPPGEIFVGTGFRDALWPDAPAPDLLEVGGHAVALLSGDVHSAWLNRAAVRALGLAEDSWFVREQAAFDVGVRLSDVPASTLDRWVADAARAAAARGVVGVHDLDMADAPGAWVRRAASGLRTLRVRAAVYPEGMAAALASGVRTGVALPGTGGLVAGGHLKLFADGSLNTRTAWCDDPYPDAEGPEAHGLPAHAPEELLALASDGVSRGLVPTIHAIGDRAVAAALDTFAALRRRDVAVDRFRMEHAQLVRPEDLPRFAALGVVASVQPGHAMDDRDVAERYWPGRTRRAYAYRALLDAGAELVFGSDAPVAPLDPWVAIAAAVTRERDGRPAWHPEQAISAAEALAASTDGVTGVREGGVADLAIVERDPLTASGDELRTMPVAGTLLAGEWTHRAFGG